MIKLEIDLEDIDYEALLSALGQNIGAAAGVAPSLVKLLPPQKRDALAAEIVNKNSRNLSSKLEELAAGAGIKGKITRISASAK